MGVLIGLVVDGDDGGVVILPVVGVGHEDVALADLINEFGFGCVEFGGVGVVNEDGGEGVGVGFEHVGGGAGFVVVEKALEGGGVGVRERGGFFGDEKGVGQGGGDLFEDRGGERETEAGDGGIDVEEGSAPAVVGEFGFAEEFGGDLIFGQRYLLGGAVGMEGKVLGAEADADAEAGRAHDGEVGVIEFSAAVGESGVGDNRFHLGGDAGDVVRGADVAGGLRIRLAFDVPGNDALRTEALEISDIGFGLGEHAALEGG